MTICVPDPESDDTYPHMLPAVAAALLRPWFTAHLVTVRRALAWFGVTDREDRADLTQDVFFSAYLALVRGERIDNPRAWLRESARKHASNYRHKELRRSPHVGGEPVGHVSDPEQIAADRERLRLAFEGLTEDAQAIVFDIRADGVSWGEVARERGITIDQARYIYQRAVSQMEEALKRDEPKKTRRGAGLPIELALLGGAAGAEADDVSPDTRRRLWESLEQRMDAVSVSAVDPGREHAHGPPSSPMAGSSKAALAPHPALGTVAGLLGGGIAVGIMIGYLLRGLSPARSSLIPSPAGQASTLAAIAPPDSRSALAVPLAPTSRTSPAGATTRHEPHSAPIGARQRGTPAAPSPKVDSSRRSTKLIDSARSALTVGNAREALDMMTQHARQFPEKQEAEMRRGLLQLICSNPTAFGAPECSNVPSGAAPD
jgi:RNA polymerase sigma factor (sigma-70 family)